MPRKTIEYKGYNVAYGKCSATDSIYTEGMDDCVSVILINGKGLRLLHISGGNLTSGGPEADRFKAQFVDKAVVNNRVVIAFGPRSSGLVSRNMFLSQDLVKSLLDRVNPANVFIYSGSSVEVWANGLVHTDGTPAIPLLDNLTGAI